MLSRALVVYGLTALTNLITKNKVPFSYRHVLFWGGLRGAISLALALSLPLALAERDTLRVMTFGVVLFTLLGQGTTMQFLMRRLGLGVAPALELEYERRHGRLLASQAALRRLEDMHQSSMISLATWREVEPKLKDQVAEALDAQITLLKENPDLQTEEREDVENEALRAQRATLYTMLSNGVISEEVYEELIQEVDAAIAHVGAQTEEVAT